MVLSDHPYVIINVFIFCVERIFSRFHRYLLIIPFTEEEVFRILQFDNDVFNAFF